MNKFRNTSSSLLNYYFGFNIKETSEYCSEGINSEIGIYIDE